MRAAIFKGVGQPLSIEEIPDPTPTRGQAVIKVERCGICGSDLHFTESHAPEHFRFPVDAPLGHEFVGEVTAIGPDTEGVKIGDRVSAMPIFSCGSCAECQAANPARCASVLPNFGGFAEYHLVAVQASVVLPQSLSIEDGALIEPMAVGLHGVVLAQMSIGARVLVIGAGPIGLAATYWARRLGSGHVAVTASTRRREELAMVMGADSFVLPEQDRTLPEVVIEALGRMPDLVLECVGLPGQIERALDCVRPGGTVVSLGFCTTQETFVPAFLSYKEARIVGSVAYKLAEFEHVARVFDKGGTEARAMITRQISLDELPDTFEALRSSKTDCKVLVNPWQ